MADTAGARRQTGRLWVLVRVAGSRLAIDSNRVRELMELPAVTVLPGLPPGTPGVITWRGRVVAAIDLAVRLDLPHAGAGAQTGKSRMAVVVAVDAGYFALIVDGVEGVEALAADSVSPLPLGLADPGRPVREHARTAREGALVLLLDVDVLLGQRGDAAANQPGAGSGRAAERPDEPVASSVVAPAPADTTGGTDDATPPAAPKRRPRAAASRKVAPATRGPRVTRSRARR